MKIYDGCNDKGELVYFEVENHFLSRIAACKIVSTVPGTCLTYRQRAFSLFADEVFCKFEMGGRKFELWEPFGDNSRFHVSATPLSSCAELDVLRTAFQSHRPFWGVLPWIVLVAGFSCLTYSTIASKCFSLIE